MRKKLTQRDQEILNTCKEFKVINVKCISELYFEGKNKLLLAQKRLKKLHEYGELNRSKRNDILEEYHYYLGKKPTNYKHALLILKAYTDIKSKYEILNYKRECEIKYKNVTLRADLVCIIKDSNGKPLPLIIEIQNGKLYKDKWSEYISNGYWKNKFGVKPEIVVYSKHNSYQSSIPIHFIKIEG